MAAPLLFTDVLTDSLDRTRRLALPSLPYGLLFSTAFGGLVYIAGALPEDGAGFLIFASLALVCLFTHSLYSVSMYHAVLPAAAGTLKSAWTLTLAWVLVIVVAAIGASMIVLFFALIGASLGVGTSENVETITDMTAQMREGGTFWPLFLLFLATLFGVFWFAVRLMTFAAASATRRGVHVFRTWYWTKGHFRTLGPAMLVLIAVPIAVLGYLAGIVTSGWGDDPASPIQSGFTAAVFMIILLPSAWLGHGFAASVFARLAPSEDADQTTTPAS